MVELLKIIFENANSNLLKNDILLFSQKVSERALCGALMIHLYQILKDTPYRDYYVDVEYNRNKGGKLKTAVKTIKGPGTKIIKINCDLIVHSRGENIQQDNLIAVEMKKNNRPLEEKENDRDRLKCLTSDSFDNIWSFNGTTLPEHVCRYKLGVYYEINFLKRKILLEYYVGGEKESNKNIDYISFLT